jgi:hypothetical protein
MIFVFGIFVIVLLLLRNCAVVDIFTPGMMLVFLKFLVVVFVRRVLPEANALDVARVAVVVVVNAAALCIFALLALYIYNFICVKFKRREKEDKMEDERKGKKVNERSEKKRRRDKEEDLQEKEARRRRRRDVCVHIYIHKSAWHRVRDTSRVFAALTFARYDAERLSRGVFFATSRVKKKRSVFGKRNEGHVSSLHY